jgi:hypothetical protein
MFFPELKDYSALLGEIFVFTVFLQIISNALGFTYPFANYYMVTTCLGAILGFIIVKLVNIYITRNQHLD